MKITFRGVGPSIVIIGVLTVALAVQTTTATKDSFICSYKEFSPASSFASHKGAAFATGQKAKKQTIRSLDQVPIECEGAEALLDFAIIETKKLEGAYLIIISRLGTGEVSTRLNLTRLAIAEEYVLRRGSDLKYVLAQGSRVRGLGRLEVYVSGRLKDILPFKRNVGSPCAEAQEE